MTCVGGPVAKAKGLNIGECFIVETFFFLVSTESNIYFSFLCQEASRRTMY